MTLKQIKLIQEYKSCTNQEDKRKTALQIWDTIPTEFKEKAKEKTLCQQYK